MTPKTLSGPDNFALSAALAAGHRPNIFPASCSVCAARIRKIQGIRVEVAGAWKFYCAKHLDRAPSPKASAAAAPSVAAPAAPAPAAIAPPMPTAPTLSAVRLMLCEAEQDARPGALEIMREIAACVAFCAGAPIRPMQAASAQAPDHAPTPRAPEQVADVTADVLASIGLGPRAVQVAPVRPAVAAAPSRPAIAAASIAPSKPAPAVVAPSKPAPSRPAPAPAVAAPSKPAAGPLFAAALDRAAAAVAPAAPKTAAPKTAAKGRGRTAAPSSAAPVDRWAALRGGDAD